jgi:hypothetical protein
MMEVVGIIQRLGETPATLERMVRARGEKCDALHDYIDRQKAIEIIVAGKVASERDAAGRPRFSNEALRRAEEARRLSVSAEYQAVLREVAEARRQLRELDALIEGVQRRHRSDTVLIGLITALLSAGRREDAEVVLQAYAGQAEATLATEPEATPEPAAPAAPVATPAAPAPEPAAPAAPAAQAAQAAPAAGQAASASVETPEEVFVLVLETRAAKSEGVIRAWCRLEDGSTTAIFGKNGIGEALASTVGRTARVKVRRGNAGYIALRVDPA